jgi:hypothetical protein
MQRQASGEAAYGALQQAPRGSLPKPCIPRKAQAQGLWHDEELHDLEVPHLGCGAQQRSGWERYDAFPHGKCRHDGLWGTIIPLVLL